MYSLLLEDAACASPNARSAEYDKEDDAGAECDDAAND